MVNEKIQDRLSRLRGRMAERGIDIFLIPTADFHNSEYVAAYFQTRHFFSGFTGSAGTLAVGREEAGLWTDGRYYIQAEKELAGTGIDLYRDGEEGVPRVADWIADRLRRGGTVGFDGRCVTVRTYRDLQKAWDRLQESADASDRDASSPRGAGNPAPAAECVGPAASGGEGTGNPAPAAGDLDPSALGSRGAEGAAPAGKEARRGLRFVLDMDPAEGIWQDRPARPAGQAFVLEEKYAGEPAASKLARLRARMADQGAGIYVESGLDRLMWLFNLRGRDIECTPVALGFGVVTMDRALLFLQGEAVTRELRAYAAGIGLELLPYDDVYAFLEDPATYRAAAGGGGGRPPKDGAGRQGAPLAGAPAVENHRLHADRLRAWYEPGNLSCRLLDALQRGRERAAGLAGHRGPAGAAEGPSAFPEGLSALPAGRAGRAGGDIEKGSPLEAFKAVKNGTELANIRDCYREDSAAVCKFLYWLHKKVESGAVARGEVTELDAAAKMDSLRAKIRDFVDLSFGTISAYGPNAAMMHYAAKPGDCATLEPRGMLLVDCGGQYLRGTTDVTRTMALGPVTDDMRRHYTLTAVGNLQLMDAVFLHGCTGRNVDILARQPLWRTFVDYKCGTGHGIGYMLGVHEGPQNIRWRFAPGMEEAVLEPGMIVSDEPGVYMEGQYGIRIETILEVVEAQRNGDGRFLRFAPLTFVPLDAALIDPAHLTPQTRQALNAYHARTYEEVAPYLEPAEREWIYSQTRPI